LVGSGNPPGIANFRLAKISNMFERGITPLTSLPFFLWSVFGERGGTPKGAIARQSSHSKQEN